MTRFRRSAVTIGITIVLVATLVSVVARSAAAATPVQLNLNVLLIGTGSSDPTTAAWQSALSSEGVAYTSVTASGSYGAETVTLPALTTGSVGNFNGVVLADSPTAFAAGQLSALFSYESSYGVRQIDGYMYPSPALGLTDASAGALDGTNGTLTAAGLSALPGLTGTVPFDTGTYGYTATIDAGAPFTPWLENATGQVLAGVYQHPGSGDPQAGVAELSLTFDYDASMLQWLLLAPGLINWVTQGTHLGLNRNYFGQDIDDNFIADNEWSSQYQCTPAATNPVDYTCPAAEQGATAGSAPGVPADVQMSAADVATVVAWEQTTGIKLNMAFNAAGACTAPSAADESSANCTGSVTDPGGTYTDPGQTVDGTAPNDQGLVNALLTDQADFNWINHTWSHQFLGCIVWQPQAVNSVTANATGGTFTAGGYSYEITAATAYGESEPSLPQGATVAANGSVTLSWPEATNGTGTDGTAGPTLAQEEANHTGGTGFWGYNIYRENPGSTAYGLVGQVAENPAATSATTYSYTDSGTAPGAAPDSSATYPTATNPGIDCSSAAGSWDPATSTSPDASIEQEIGQDQAFATANGLTNFNPAAVVTGEHSGIENPNMPSALAGAGITTFAADASRQPTQYAETSGANTAESAPRYPNNIYYNASTWADELNEYNTLYVKQGVSLGDATYTTETGHCTDTSATTCLTTPATEASLEASESHIMLSHVLANNPRVVYDHQTDLIGPDYTLLGLISNMLSQYNSWYNSTTPLVQMTDVTEAQTLGLQSAWASAQSAGSVKASEQNGVVTVTNSTGTPVSVPITVPTGTTVGGTAFGSTYSGELSAWTPVPATGSTTLTENVAPVITTANAATSIVGTAFSDTVATTGDPTPALTETGALPSGITFTDNGNGTATLAGTAAKGSGGSYPITITATSTSGTATQVFTLTNAEAPTITSASTTSFSTGVAGTYTVTTTGYPAPSLTESGTLPAGLTFTDNGNGTATLAGTPATGTAGSYPVTISATNISGSTAKLSLAITVTASAAPVITSGATAYFTLNSGGAFAVSTTGAPAPAITEVGVLPAGLTFVDLGNGSALLSGTPTATGTTTLTVTAANGLTPNATQTLTVIVGQGPAITSAASTSFAPGVAGSFTVTTTGYPAPSLGESGALPSGLTFVNNGNGTATISGTPTGTGTGASAITITATNATGTVTQAFTLDLTAAATITSAASTTLTVGQPASFTVTTAGFPTPKLTESGALPSGVAFTDNGNGTATLTGTLTAASVGAFKLTITATNSIGTTNQAFTLTVISGSLSITSAASTTFTAGTAGSFTVTATGTTTPTITEGGALPAGITFAAGTNGTATLSGTPAATDRGNYPITFTATNSAGKTSQAFVLTVDQVPTITSAATLTETAATAFTFTVAATAYPTASLTETGTLPSGVTFKDNGNGTATIAGSAAAGTSTLTFKATNAGGSATQTFTLTVNAAGTSGANVPVFTSAASTTVAVSATFDFTVTTEASSQSATFTTNLSKSGTLPPGVSFSNNGDGTAAITGPATSAGVFPFTITAKNSAGSTTQSFVLTVTGAPKITSAATATATVGSTFSFTVKTSGAPQPALTETGSLPAGLTFTDNGNGTASLSGTPNAGTGGLYTITITATNSGGTTTQTFKLTVAQTPTITNASSASAAHGTAFSFKFTTAGYPVPTITHTGTVSGLSWSNTGSGTFTLSGTPRTAGTYTLTVTATNSAGKVTQTFTLKVT
jgi:hypothetical protein